MVSMTNLKIIWKVCDFDENILKSARSGEIGYDSVIEGNWLVLELARLQVAIWTKNVN